MVSGVTCIYLRGRSEANNLGLLENLLENLVWTWCYIPSVPFSVSSTEYMPDFYKPVNKDYCFINEEDLRKLIKVGDNIIFSISVVRVINTFSSLSSLLSPMNVYYCSAPQGSQYLLLWVLRQIFRGGRHLRPLASFNSGLLLLRIRRQASSTAL